MTKFFGLKRFCMAHNYKLQNNKALEQEGLSFTEVFVLHINFERKPWKKISTQTTWRHNMVGQVVNKK